MDGTIITTITTLWDRHTSMTTGTETESSTILTEYWQAEFPQEEALAPAAESAERQHPSR